MDGNVITIGLFGASANSPNLGVGALTVGQMAIAEEVARTRGLRLRFVILGWADPEPAYVTGDAVSIIALRGRGMVTPGGALWRAVRRCDLMLDIGAGDSFADIYGPGRILRLLLVKATTLALGCPVILSPQTYGPFRRGWARRLSLMTIRRARAVLTRDALSTAYLREMGFDGPVTEATDVALRLPYDPPPPRGEGPPRVGLNASGLIFNGGYTRNNMFGLACDFPALMRGAIAAFQARGAEVHLVGHVNPTDMPVEDDHAVCAALAAEFPGAVLAPRFASPSAAKSYIAGLDFFAGARMHACIAAFSTGVPVIPLAYSRKFAGLFGTLGYDLTADCRTETAEAILAKLLAAYDNRAALADQIAACRAEGERRLDAFAAVLGAEFDRLTGSPGGRA